MENPLRKIPSVNQLLESPPLKSLVESANHNAVVTSIRSALDQLRVQVQSRAEDINVPTPHELAQKIADWIKQEEKPRLRPVINATGVILHTGLGRAPLAKEAIEEITSIAEGYASVELDLETGKRTQRAKIVERLLCELTGAQAAVVVNNNAAATMITLSALAKDREVVVSRGQLVEIGGSYRLPDVMANSGAKMVEVGTTNKTRLADYEKAITENTGCILRVHPSNFRVVGFTDSVSLSEMVSLGKHHRIPVVDDIGSGALLDFAKFGLEDEPLAIESIKQGADLALFSGDKLLGGPQCGIIVGQKKYVDMILKSPLCRAMRVCKLTLAALHATLRLYRDPSQAENSIPCLAALSTSVQNLKLRAERLAPQVEQLDLVAGVKVVECQATLGGGSLPGQQIDSVGLQIEPKTISADLFAARLRAASPAVVGRIEDDRIVMDLRTIAPSEDITLIQSIAAATRQDDN